LAIDVKPPVGEGGVATERSAELDLDDAVGGLPGGTVAFGSESPQGPGLWEFDVDSDELDHLQTVHREALTVVRDGKRRLKPAVLQDLLIVCHYSLATAHGG
jgi:hypothetical protein